MAPQFKTLVRQCFSPMSAMVTYFSMLEVKTRIGGCRYEACFIPIMGKAIMLITTFSG